MVITAVTDDLVPQVKEFLSTRKEFGFHKDWDGIFGYQWKRNDFPYGYAIIHDGAIVGFLGTMFCDRTIGGSERVYCSLCAWVVDDSHRGARSLALALLAPALRIKNVVIACYTANEKAQKNYEKIGFKRIDGRQMVLPTFFSLRMRIPRGSRQVTFDPRVIEVYLNEKDGKIYRDHRSLACTHLLVMDTITRRYCYVIGTTTPLRFRRLPMPFRTLLRPALRSNFFNICYVSDPAFLAENIGLVNRHLWKSCNSLALRYDSRLIPPGLSILEYKMSTVRLCFSATDFQYADIDNLYSELVTDNTY